MPGQAPRVPGRWGSQISRQGFEVVNPSTGRFYPPGSIPGTYFCQRLSQPHDHSATGRILSMKNSNDTFGNRTRDFPSCSAVPQPSAPPLAPKLFTDTGPSAALGPFLPAVHACLLYAHSCAAVLHSWRRFLQLQLQCPPCCDDRVHS